MDGLRAPIPPLPDEQVALLATIDAEGPAVVPVSALVREDERRLLLALSLRRASLARASADRRAAISVSGPGFSVSARGTIEVVARPLAGAEFMAALRFTAGDAWDTRGAGTEIVAGIDWRWTEADADDRHASVLRALAALARGPGYSSAV